MSDIKFTLRPENLTVRSVFERSQQSFPKLIQVTQGHHGDIDLDTFSTGHIMRIHTYSKQRRVLARDTQGRQLSIPINYKMRFRISKNTKKAAKEYMLREIIENNTLPIRVELCTPPAGYSLHIGQNVKNVDSFGMLNLLQTYDETYLLANSIVEGTMDPEVLFVPIYLQSIVVSMINGMDGKTESEYHTFLEQMNRMADTIHFDTTGGNDDIAVYSSDSISVSSENLYDYIEPQHFIKYRATYNNRRPSMPTLLNIQEIKDKLENRPKVFPKPTSGIYSTAGQMHPKDPSNYADKAPPIPKRTSYPKPEDIAAVNAKTNPHYVNDVARATVKPLAKPTPLTTVTPPTGRPSSAEDAGASTHFIKGLTIDKLADRLDLLKLGKYSQSFRDAQISGDLLLDLDETILKEDFEMKGYEAIKLMKFAKTGYIPR